MNLSPLKKEVEQLKAEASVLHEREEDRAAILDATIQSLINHAKVELGCDLSRPTAIAISALNNREVLNYIDPAERPAAERALEALEEQIAMASMEDEI